MPSQHGKATFVSINAVDLSTYVKNSELEFTADDHDQTTYGNDGHVYEGGLTDGTATVSGKYDTTAGTGPRAVLLPLVGSAVPVIHRPEGTGAGKPQDSFSGLVTSYKQSHPVADYVQWEVALKISGDVNSTPQGA